jgi:hypothetical protein
MTTESNLCVLRNKRKGVVDVSWLSAQSRDEVERAHDGLFPD